MWLYSSRWLDCYFPAPDLCWGRRKLMFLCFLKARNMQILNIFSIWERSHRFFFSRVHQRSTLILLFPLYLGMTYEQKPCVARVVVKQFICSVVYTILNRRKSRKTKEMLDACAWSIFGCLLFCCCVDLVYRCDKLNRFQNSEKDFGWRNSLRKTEWFVALQICVIFCWRRS